jgi:hypothetical protein
MPMIVQTILGGCLALPGIRCHGHRSKAAERATQITFEIKPPP